MARLATITTNDNSIQKSVLQVPGWGGQETNNTVQPWHLRQFQAFADNGLEITYPYEDVCFESKCTSPFIHISDMYYALDMQGVLEVSQDYCLLVIPHYRYYTDPEWTTPLPLACSWESWWPFPLTIMFRYGPKQTVFRKGDPIAQIVVFPQTEMRILHGDVSETERTAAYVDEMRDKYVTRRWTTASGYVQDNLYNVLSLLNREQSLPWLHKTKKYRVWGGKHAQVVQDKPKKE